MDTFFNRWPWKYRVFLDESSEIIKTCLRKMLCRWHDNQRVGRFFETTDFNGSSDRQCSLCSRNCERQGYVRGSLLHIVYFLKPVYHSSF